MLGDGQRVDGLAALIQRLDRAKDDPVTLPVEVLVAEPHVEDHGGDRALGHHHRAQHRGLGLEVLGRDVCSCLGHLRVGEATGMSRRAIRIPRSGEPHGSRMRPAPDGTRANHRRLPSAGRVPAIYGRNYLRRLRRLTCLFRC